MEWAVCSYGVSFPFLEYYLLLGCRDFKEFVGFGRFRFPFGFRSRLDHVAYCGGSNNLMQDLLGFDDGVAKKDNG